MPNLLGVIDLVLAPIYLFVIIRIAKSIKNKKLSKFSHYKYFVKGVYFKLIGVTLFVLFYQLYYSVGDTVSYFMGSKAMVNLLLSNFENGIAVIFNLFHEGNQYGSFDLTTGYPPHYMWKDTKTFNVSRLTVPLYIIGGGSFLTTSFMTSLFSFTGIWKLYTLITTKYPGFNKQFFYLLIAVPSLLFWGGGIMKDSFVFGATCWAFYNFYKIFEAKKKIILNMILIIFNFLIIINIKTYIGIALFSGFLTWFYGIRVGSIKTTLIKFLFVPVALLLFITTFSILYNNLEILGLQEYKDVDQTLEQAQVIQQDLLRGEQYGTNNYDIGEIDGTFSGMLKVAPLAIFSAILRPTVLEIGSPAMIFSAVENLILTIYIIIIILKVNPINFFRHLLSDSFLITSFVFVIILGFGVGIAGTNFGALVRYRIPIIPFFYSMIYIISKKASNNL